MFILYFIHFGNKSPDLATCKDCLNYRQGLCSGEGGADDVFECMYDKAKGCEFIFFYFLQKNLLKSVDVHIKVRYNIIKDKEI